MDQTTIRAPFDAVVSDVYKHPGDLVGPGESIATLITTEKVVEGKISEEDFADIRLGQKASVMFLPYGNAIFDGSVTKILPTADPETQRHIVLLDVPIAPEKLVPGINGEVSIVVGEHEARAIVPRRALFSLDGDHVFRGHGRPGRARAGEERLRLGRGVEILDGLQPGEQVIVEDLENFHDGRAGPHRGDTRPDVRGASVQSLAMSPNLRIALRFLTAKKRSMMLSLSCIILGVGLFIVTQATTTGFEGYFVKTILGTDGAMRIQDKIQDTLRSIVAGSGYGSPFARSTTRTAANSSRGSTTPG